MWLSTWATSKHTLCVWLGLSEGCSDGKKILRVEGRGEEGGSVVKLKKMITFPVTFFDVVIGWLYQLLLVTLTKQKFYHFVPVNKEMHKMA
jgi:hypothetical protein